VSASDEIDYVAAYDSYVARFESFFGDRPPGSFVKLGKHMVQRLAFGHFPMRLDQYVALHRAVTEMLDSGSTISDALVLEFVEASAWIAIEAPNMYAMFRGELGDPKDAAPGKLRNPDTEITDPDMDAQNPEGFESGVFAVIQSPREPADS
jgi:hypothetical protein